MVSAQIVIMRVGWPAFLAACALQLLVFAVVDPLELHWGGHALGMSRQAVYTAAFFAFWAISAAACTVTVVLGWQEPRAASASDRAA